MRCSILTTADPRDSRFWDVVGPFDGALGLLSCQLKCWNGAAATHGDQKPEGDMGVSLSSWCFLETVFERSSDVWLCLGSWSHGFGSKRVIGANRFHTSSCVYWQMLEIWMLNSERTQPRPVHRQNWYIWRIMPDGKTYKSIYCHSKGYEAQKNLWFSWFNSLGSQCIFHPPLMIPKLSVPPSRSPAVPVRNLRKWGSPKAPNVQARNSIQQENVRVQIYVWLYFVSLDLRYFAICFSVWWSMVS